MNLQRENVEKSTDAVSVTICPVSHHHAPHSFYFLSCWYVYVLVSTSVLETERLPGLLS